MSGDLTGLCLYIFFFSVMYTHFGHIHSVMLIRSCKYSPNNLKLCYLNFVVNEKVIKDGKTLPHSNQDDKNTFVVEKDKKSET